MSLRYCFLALLIVGFLNCKLSEDRKEDSISNTKVKVVGALRNVMQKGDLQGRIYLDTIPDRKGLYGLGPEEYLRGELLISNGKSYVSHVMPDSTIDVLQTFNVSAPFLVYGNVDRWQEINLSPQIKSLHDLERFIEEQTIDSEQPFAFRLAGMASHAAYHIQNLPEGTRVSSPEEAHKGQVNYELADEKVEIIGFFSKNHKGIFTHHDSYVHMHLVTEDKRKMGHLDALEIGEMALFLPKKH